MREFFPDDVRTTIRLDEIDWGGVRINGIPPLHHPRVHAADQATYLSDTNVVFGVVVNGEARGPLVGSGIELVALPVVTTTWREWRTRHPKTTVLAEETGHARDYSEGAAYRSYFATDELMFQVPQPDTRLRNKAEVLAVLLTNRQGGSVPVAISADFLARNRLYQHRFAEHSIVVVTSRDGANRVYEAGTVRFVRLVDDDTLRDSEGRDWNVGEEGLTLRGPASRSFRRIAARRAFWFGWHAQFPRTELVR